ncbi:hypothetical protein [Herbaspirillum huttiense]|uniref:hypothetical protein n=1 Tax=Herbaspirillum huttiense TaxID=863372 RepID=UPI0012FF3C0F|nr:hypothetical protein [Herbaspirillum huttiense]
MFLSGVALSLKIKVKSMPLALVCIIAVVLACAIGVITVSFVAISLTLAQKISTPGTGDLATWFGAIGTIGTLFYTVRIASTGEKIRREESMQRAVIQAAGISLQISKLRILLVELQKAMHFSAINGASIELFIGSGHTLKSASIWSLDDAQKLVALPNDCAIHVAFCRSQIDAFVEMLMTVDKNTLLRSESNRRAFALDSIEYIRNLLMSLSKAESECRSALEGHLID